MLSLGKHKKIVSVLAIVAVFAIPTGAVFGWGFRGGEVYDAANEIKHIVEKIKASDLVTSYQKKLDNLKKYSKELDTIKQNVNDVKTVWGSIQSLKADAKGLLNSKDKVKQDFKDLYHIDLMKGINIEEIQQSVDAGDKKREEEVKQAYDVAADTSKASNRLQEEAESIRKLESEGKIGTQQKIAMLTALYAEARQLRGFTANQELMITIADDGNKQIRRDAAAIERAKNDFAITPSHQETIKLSRDIRIKELPK